MPRNVRNFWVEVEVDGYKTTFAGGPRAKEGGVKVTIKQRDNGAITEPVCIHGYADGSELVLRSCKTVSSFEHRTKR